jgi:hypothetical protein
MSIKTTRFKQKIAQFALKNGKLPIAGDILPLSRAKSDGKKTIFISADGVDDDGKPVRAGKRIPGRAIGLVGTEPIGAEKADRLMRLVK